MGLVVALGLAIAALAILWRYAALSAQGAALTAGALLVALTGYVLQSHPALPGVPIAERAASGLPDDPEAIATRRAMSGQFTGSGQIADFALTLDRLGLTREAIIAVKTALAKQPDNADLWVALGNTIVAHGGDMTSPSAEFAFDRAAALSPQHPAPPFFKALALAKSGRIDEAEGIWRALLARVPQGAPWRADIEARLAQMAMIRSMAASQRR